MGSKVEKRCDMENVMGVYFMGIGIIIPSDCPDEQLFRLIDQLNARKDIRVLVVDDGCDIRRNCS